MDKIKKNFKDYLLYLRRVPAWLWLGIRRKPFEWVGVNGDEQDDDYTEPWNYRVWMAVRPRYWGLMKTLPCGCSRRLGRIALYRLGCKTHGIGMEGID